MANVGMQYPVYAGITTETAGSAITYSAGAVLAHAIAATVNFNRTDNSLYGDDCEIENDNGLRDYSIDLEVDNIPLAARAALLGYKEVTGSGSTVTHYEMTEDSAPYVGFGFVRVIRVGGVNKYEGFWFHKVRFAQSNESASTKKETIEFGTYSLSGNGAGVVLDNTGKVKFYDWMQFESLAAAKSWINGKAGIQ